MEANHVIRAKLSTNIEIDAWKMFSFVHYAQA